MKEQAFTIEKLQAELKEFKRLAFGAKSERFVPSLSLWTEQTEFDLGLELPEKPEVEIEKISYDRRKKANKKHTPHGRKHLPDHLPRKEHIIEPDEDVANLKKIGEEITEELEYTPGAFYVNRYIRPKHAKPEDG